MEEEEEEEVEEQTTENEKKCLFSFAKINKYFIIPFLCPIIGFLANIFIELMQKNTEFKVDLYFPVTMFACLTYFGGGLLYFVSYIRTKTEETRNNAIAYKERERASSAIIYIYNENEPKKNIWKIFGFLLIMSIVIPLFSISYLYIVYNKYQAFEERILTIICIPLFSKYILKNSIFSHQILSLIISLIGMIFIFIPTIRIFAKEFIVINIIRFIVEIYVSLQLVLVKHLTHNYYVSPYYCLLFLGTFSLILTIIGFLVYASIVKDLSIITDAFDLSAIKNGLLCFIYFFFALIFGILLQIFRVLVIFYFSPTLLMVTDIINPMLLWIYTCLGGGDDNTNDITDNILYGIGYFIVLFGSLIYNEIIICNFFGFNKNTKKGLDERLREESVALKKTENDIKTGNVGTDTESSESSEQ